MNDAIYLSYFIDNYTPIYGGSNDSKFIKSNSSINDGNTSNTLLLNIPNHIGTHIDFPYHFSNNGKKCSDYDANFWIFKKIGFLECSIEELPNKIFTIPSDIEILILKTGFGIMRGKEEYWRSQPIFPSNYANIIKQRFPKIRVFGFDLISMTSKLDREEGKNAHIEFLINNDILILEDMNLVNVTSLKNTLIICPLQITNADGTPCTVLSYTNL